MLGRRMSAKINNTNWARETVSSVLYKLRCQISQVLQGNEHRNHGALLTRQYSQLHLEECPVKSFYWLKAYIKKSYHSMQGVFNWPSLRKQIVTLFSFFSGNTTKKSNPESVFFVHIFNQTPGVGNRFGSCFKDVQKVQCKTENSVVR